MRDIAHRLVSLFATFACLSGWSVAYAEVQLYETGPDEELAYVRFVNATDKDVAIVSSNGAAKVALSTQAEGRVSRFYKVKAGSKLAASIQAGGGKVSVDVVGKPWEYITIAIVPGGAAQVKTMLVRETPTDFNAMRSSLALFNLDASCKVAGLQGGAKNVSVLSDVKPYTVQRRLVNPVKLSAGVTCAGQSSATPVDVPQMQAGERYSVFLLTLKNARQAVFAHDAN